MKSKKPPWIATSIDLTSFQEVMAQINNYQLHVVCFEASCPNIGTCFTRRTATFLILGDICTRNCRFCGITHGKPSNPDPNEPKNVAKLVRDLNLRHVVITSVTRDDLPDQGADQFINIIREIRKICAEVIIEVLIPDFQGNKDLLLQLIQEEPHIINHNVETVPSLYPKVRPEADYLRSLGILAYIKEQAPAIYTKSGFMVGLGETNAEIRDLIQDLKKSNCDILTIGQYLRSSESNLPVMKYYSPKEFQKLEEFGKTLGFLYINAAPLIRSSFNAVDFSKKFIHIY
ncbi:MAG TPA: lipoyl synthase [Candidatus Deferrimicrobium sp.]|nr:lipoyl synthase [Candidatus Deferrimicrobium sp.]